MARSLKGGLLGGSTLYTWKKDIGLIDGSLAQGVPFWGFHTLYLEKNIGIKHYTGLKKTFVSNMNDGSLWLFFYIFLYILVKTKSWSHAGF